MSDLDFRGKYWTFDKNIAFVYEKRDNYRYLGTVSFYHNDIVNVEETEWDRNGDNRDRKEWGLNSRILPQAYGV